jgi:hypothetical protein
MFRYYVEFKNYDEKQIYIYVMAYNPEQVKDMLSDYVLIACDQTD